MLRESILIKNFGPISEAEIQDVKKLTIFIGDSGSGKSTIMKVLVLFQWIFKELCIRSYLKASGVVENVSEFRFKELLNQNGLLDYLKDDTEIVYKRGSYSILYKNKKLNTRVDIDFSDISLEKMSYISDKRNLIPDLMSERVSQMQLANFYLRETLEDFKIAFSEMETLDIPSLNVVLEKVAHKYKPELVLEGKDELLPYKVKLEDSSSGMQNVVPLYLIVQYYTRHYNMTEAIKKTIKNYMFSADILDQFNPSNNLSEIKNRNIHFHIEEPELSLYPDGQLILLQNLVDTCFKDVPEDTSISMIMSTHSPYIMNYLNLLIKKGDLSFDDIGAYQVSNGELITLMRPNNQVVDTRSLSDPIQEIYRKYNS